MVYNYDVSPYVLDNCLLKVLGLEADQSVEYGTRRCQDLSRVVHRLITDGKLTLLFNYLNSDGLETLTLAINVSL